MPVTILHCLFWQPIWQLLMVLSGSSTTGQNPSKPLFVNVTLHSGPHWKPEQALGEVVIARVLDMCELKRQKQERRTSLKRCGVIHRIFIAASRWSNVLRTTHLIPLLIEQKRSSVPVSLLYVYLTNEYLIFWCEGTVLLKRAHVLAAHSSLTTAMGWKD